MSYAKDNDFAAWEADTLIDKLGGKGVAIYLDLEWEEQCGLGKDAVTDIAVTFIQHCQARGYEANIYSNVNWYNNYYYLIQENMMKDISRILGNIYGSIQV